MNMDVKIDGDTLAKLQHAFERAPTLTAEQFIVAANRALNGYRDTARNLAPTKSGHLRNNMTVTPAKNVYGVIQGSVQTNSPYARYQEEGTGIYGPYKRSIRPRNKTVMVFEIGGKKIFTTKVKGVRPKRFMLNSFNQRQNDTMRYFAFAADKVARILAGGQA